VAGVAFTVSLRLVILLLAAAVACAATSSRADAAAGLRTAFYDPYSFEGSEAPLAFARTKAAGASAARLSVAWGGLVPGGADRPKSFNASDPADPNYSWGKLDQQVRLATAGGMAPILSIYAPPGWAQQPVAGLSANRPNVGELRLFATAIARRYSGTFADLPRVRYWQVWNEPNLGPFLAPQAVNGKSTSPKIYRDLVNAMADSVKEVHASNLVVAGGLAPFSIGNRDPAVVTAPLKFMRELLCLKGRVRPRATCRDRTRFDIWAMHPYTTGGPLHTAAGPDDVSLGDLPAMRRTLDAGDRSGRIAAPRPVQFWVTEFSWDTSPPDPGGVPLQLHARWTSEAMYRMWKSGVSLVTWFLIADRPHVQGARFEFEFQSGLYFRGAGDSLRDIRAKPALRAFRFPFVALREGRKVLVWGRAPSSKAAEVIVERRVGGRWLRVAKLRTDRNGIFQRRLPRQAGTAYRGRVTGPAGGQTVSFALKAPRDARYNPFGGALYGEG
jgi:hypothetical protein